LVPVSPPFCLCTEDSWEKEYSPLSNVVAWPTIQRTEQCTDHTVCLQQKAESKDVSLKQVSRGLPLVETVRRSQLPPLAGTDKRLWFLIVTQSKNGKACYYPRTKD
ncbi:hypothetical protein BaRGS_00038257, partial [Batillaria attramentaria]